MKSNYKPIGDFIRLVDERNAGLKIPALLGLSISKEFIPSVANIIGSDMENYKIIRKNQFACSLMQVRRDKKIPIALLKEMDEAIISQAYPVFEIIEPETLLPEYLMMWFSRSEFDREACFYAVGGVRGSLEWEDFCNMQLPVPSIEKQKEIVKEYHTIVNRIKLNDQLNQKLEETAQAIYKQWFVDFEFPDENGNPYKSSGGEMVDNELGEIPKGWEVTVLDKMVEKFLSHRGKSKLWLDLRPASGEFRNPAISAMNVNNGKIVKRNTIGYANDDQYREWMSDPLQIDDVVMTSEAPMGELLFLAKRTNYLLTQRLFGIRANRKKCCGAFLYYWLKNPVAKRDMEGRASGTTAAGIKLSELKKLLVLKPPLDIIDIYDNKARGVLVYIENREEENRINKEVNSILLSGLSQRKSTSVECIG